MGHGDWLARGRRPTRLIAQVGPNSRGSLRLPARPAQRARAASLSPPPEAGCPWAGRACHADPSAAPGSCCERQSLALPARRTPGRRTSCQPSETACPPYYPRRHLEAQSESARVKGALRCLGRVLTPGGYADSTMITYIPTTYAIPRPASTALPARRFWLFDGRLGDQQAAMALAGFCARPLHLDERPVSSVNTRIGTPRNAVEACPYCGEVSYRLTFEDHAAGVVMRSACDTCGVRAERFASGWRAPRS